MAEPLTSPVLTVPEVAALLRLRHETVKRIPPAELPFFRVGARGDRRYHRADVDRYVERGRVDR